MSPKGNELISANVVRNVKTAPNAVVTPLTPSNRMPGFGCPVHATDSPSGNVIGSSDEVVATLEP